MNAESASPEDAGGPAAPSRRPRKILVVIDDTPECEIALHYAGLRARNTGARVVLLSVIEKADFQHWMAIEDLMREEAQEEAYGRLRELARDLRDLMNAEPEIIVRDGPTREAVLQIIEEDSDIRVLVLGMAGGTEGPGPLVSFFTGQGARQFPIPVLLVPGHLTFDQLEELA